jgi:hypothetical protein
MPIPAARLAAGLVAALALAAPSAAGAQEISFGPLTLYPRDEAVAPEGDHLASGDLNRDGRSDVVVADGASPQVRVWLAQSDGSLLAPTTLALDARRGLRLLDVNGDGDVDLLLSGQDALRVALGGAGGSFGPATLVGPFAGAVDVVADFNGDGDPDLAFASNGGISVTVLLGGPGGSFGAPTSYQVGDTGTQTVSQLTTADFNGDHDPDLAVALPDRVVVLVGGAGGTFTQGVRFDGEAFQIAVGDFNGDGDPDLVTTVDSGIVAVRLGLAGSAFGPPTPYNGPFSPTLLARDVDQDGYDDLLEWAPTFNEIEPGFLFVFAGAPSGQLADPTTTGIPQIASPPLVADFNRDGDPDFAYTWTDAEGAPPEQVLSILAGAAGTTFTLAPTTFVGPGADGPTVAGDFNGDGKPDVALLASLVARQPGDIDGPVLGIWLNTTTVDKTPPRIHLRVPRNGAKYRLGELVLADYDCVDRESAFTNCDGTVPDGQPIDTASVGHKTFTVRAQSAGGSATVTRHYRVVPRRHHGA